MNRCLILPVFLLLNQLAFAEDNDNPWGTNAFWSARIPSLNYQDASITQVFADVERLSRNLDTKHIGMRIIRPPGIWGTVDGTMTLHLTNATLRDAVTYVLEVCGQPFAVGEDNVYYFGWLVSGSPLYRRAGLKGGVVDQTTGVPVPDATITANYRGSQAVQADTNGAFVLVLDYTVRRPFGDGYSVYRNQDDWYQVTASSPTHLSTNVQINCGDGNAEDVIIRMNRR